ncbi:MAG: CHAT domain-containing protein [Bryobacterales bacterium]|nr:CHAT domain-containing protein [Bryobacterales bacterium]
MKPRLEHLADDVLFRLAEGAEAGMHAAHLAECRECRERLEGVRAMANELRRLRLPAERDGAEECPDPLQWALLVTGDADDRRDTMLAHAARCGHCAALLRAASDEDAPESSAKVVPLPRPRAAWRLWGAIAAGVALLSLPLWYRLLRPDPQALLAKAYTEARPFLPRIPGAMHAPLAQVRAGEPALQRPALIKAAAVLSDRAGDERYLLWKGAYELLTLRTGDAIQTLRQAQGIAGDEAALLLGAALYHRGTSTGRREDLLEALEVQAAAAKKETAGLEARFNLALTYEALQMNTQALAAWRDYVKRDGASAWGAEARRRLEALEELLRQRQGLEGSLRADPAGFLKAGGTPELTLPAFWMDWYVADGNANQAARLLARRMREEHGDAMVADVLASPYLQSAANKLAAAMRANREGGREAKVRAARLAAAAESEAAQSGNRALALRARAEKLYALHLDYRAAECLHEARAVAHRLETTAYPWMRAQVKLEMANCLAMENDYGAAIAAAAGAQRVAANARLPELDMRAAGLESGFRVQAGDLSGIYRKDGDFLARFWRAPFAPNRAQQFFSNAVRGAEALGFDRAAYELAKARLQAMAGSGPSLLQARGHAQLALLAAKVGDPQEALRQMDQASRQFAELAGGEGAMRRDAEVDLVQARTMLRIAEPGANALALLEGVMESPPTADAALRAGALAATLAPGAAGGYLDRAIAHHRTRLAGLHGWARKQAMDQGAGLYRWKAALLVEQNRWSEALDTWLGRNGNKAQWNGETIVFLTLGDSVARWRQRGQALEWQRLPARAPQLRQMVAGLRRMAADSSSLTADIDTMAARLRKELFSGWTGNHKLRIVADETFDGLPWILLAGTETGLSVERTLRFRPDDGVQLRAATVLAPAAGEDFTALYPTMPDALAESAEVAARFAHARVYRGGEATAAAIEAWGNVLHYSGHASPAGLVLAGKDGFALLGTGQVAEKDWSNTGLVCLSACATGLSERANRGSQSPAEAFLAAGANAAVASLWNVDAAATRELMRIFYARLQAGDALSDALRNAAISVKEKPAFRHPYYWAGFQAFY